MTRTLIIATSGMIFTSLFGSLALANDFEPKTWELGDGRWPSLPSTNPADSPKPDPDLKRIEQLIDSKNYSAAHKQSVEWLLANKGNINFDLGLYLSARAIDADEDPIRAFYYCDQLMDEYPASPYFGQALEAQYQIADSLLNGRELKTLGFFKWLTAKQEAVEMLFRIQNRSPGSPLADKALRRTADYYFAEGSFDLASDAYGVYAKTYPRSPEIPEVLLRQAFANYAQFNGLKFDPTPLVNARSQMVDLIDKYPDKAKKENIPAFIDSIDRTLAKKLWVTADFYKRTNKPTAEQEILKLLANTYPNTEEGQQARVELSSN